jgi:putative flippase GtrA
MLNFFSSDKFRYLLAGGVNTTCGYLLSLLIYNFLITFLNSLIIILLINFINISLSFCIYKFFVFKTVGNWKSEYLKCFLVYGNIGLINVFVLWAMIEFFNIQFWIAQAAVLIFGATISYMTHKRFTFESR